MPKKRERQILEKTLLRILLDDRNSSKFNKDVNLVLLFQLFFQKLGSEKLVIPEFNILIILILQSRQSK